MYKLVIFSALVAVAAAGISGHAKTRSIYSVPIVEKSVVHISEPVFTKIGEHVKTVPSAVSYQKQTIVHSKPLVTPVLAHSIKTYSVPVLKTYSYTAPVAKLYTTSVDKGYSTPVNKGYSTLLLKAPTAKLTIPLTHFI